MASLFDQYERSTSRTLPATSGAVSASEPVAPGYVNARLEDEVPIFNKQRINFDPPDQITQMCVCNSHLVMAMCTNILLRIDLEHPESPDEVELVKGVEDSICGLFLDPSGRHLIVTMTSGENYYLMYTSKKPRSLSKFKGHRITAVGWNRQNVTDSCTDAILIGTSKGLIFETKIVASDDGHMFSSGSLEQYVKQLYSITKDRPNNVSITGIEFDKMPSSTGSFDYFIIVTLPSRMFQFIGSVPAAAEAPIFQHVFSHYDDVPEHFIEMPGSVGYSQLHIFYNRAKSLPQQFAWMTGAGVYCGRIDASGVAGPQSVTTETKLIQYQRDVDEKTDPPLSMVLTEFHILVLFPDRMKATCTLNEQLIYNDLFSDRFGPLLGLCRDPVKETIWAFTRKAVFKYRVVRESRDIWHVYLDKNEFTLAKSFCKDNPVNFDRVLTREAEFLFANKKYTESAKIFAETQNSFEEVVLRFIALEDKEALKLFLMNKLQSLKASEKTQLTMIVAWLAEIWLNQLGQLKERGEETSSRYDHIQESFRKFLNSPRVKECVSDNRNMVYELIASHGDIEDMIFFAVLIQDLERVISHHIQQNNYTATLELLAKQANVELVYKFSPLLMQYVPHETVNMWIAMKDKLDARRLIPALVQYDDKKYAEQGSEAVRYLEYCIQKLHVRDEPIHNYLLSLYAKLKSPQLMKYLHIQGQDHERVCYDVKYALRLCAEHDQKEACVHIYTTMGLYDEAVDLALQFDIGLAKINADKPEDNEEMRKKLWLKIARHVVEKEGDIKHAMEFLQECPLLKIEDILPFFPDFVTIDNFQDAICTSLQEYNANIDALKQEMDQATESAHEIRSEIHAFRNQFSVVRAQDKCSSCSYPLMLRAFYLFPCSHAFHTDCLVNEVLPHLTHHMRAQVAELQRKIGLGSQQAGSPTAPGLETSSKEMLDEIIASECIYCGDIMIRQVDKPFVADEDFDAVIRSWL